MKIEILREYPYYTYLVIDEASQEAAVVDPYGDDPVAIAVQENNVSLTKVLNTRFAVMRQLICVELCLKFKKLQIYSGDGGIGSKVKHNDTFNIGELQVRSFATPSLISKDICYYITGDQDTPAVFTGCTLHVGGCSMLVHTTAEQMYRAFIEILGSLPNETKVYCLYDLRTEATLKFAQYVEPENQAIRQKLEWISKQHEKKIPIMPSTIQEEKLTNLFMRVHEKSVMDHTGQKDPIKIMASLQREWKKLCRLF